VADLEKKGIIREKIIDMIKKQTVQSHAELKRFVATLSEPPKTNNKRKNAKTGKEN